MAVPAGIREKNISIRSGLAVAEINNSFFNADIHWHAVTGPTIPSTVVQSAFSGTQMSFFARTISVKLITAAGGSPRTLNVRLTGKRYGEPWSNVVTIGPVNPSTTTIEESFDHFTCLNQIEFLSTSLNIAGGDTVRFGCICDTADTVHYKKIFWAVPAIPRSTAGMTFDATAGQEGFVPTNGNVILGGCLFAALDGFQSGQVVVSPGGWLAPSNWRYDHVRQGLRMIANFQVALAPPPCNILQFRSAV